MTPPVSAPPGVINLTVLFKMIATQPPSMFDSNQNPHLDTGSDSDMEIDTGSPRPFHQRGNGGIGFHQGNLGGSPADFYPLLGLCREAESDPDQEAEVQQCCDDFLQDLEEEQWLRQQSHDEWLHETLATAQQPADQFDHWTAGPPFHCSFTAVDNPITQISIGAEWCATEPWQDGVSPVDLTRQIIGRDGCYLKKITENSGAVCIWYDRIGDRFHFWGSRDALRQAVLEFHQHVSKWLYQRVDRGITFDAYAQGVHGGAQHYFPSSQRWYQWFNQTFH